QSRSLVRTSGFVASIGSSSAAKFLQEGYRLIRWRDAFGGSGAPFSDAVQPLRVRNMMSAGALQWRVAE
ncbi:MAG: hypothetical protein EB039_07400, partial [Proteobacteria bacterium]|nr:hypothetical protein [Pseudomonadota bacterium]